MVFSNYLVVRLRCFPKFTNLGCLATQIAQVVQLRAANITSTGNLDLLDDRSVQWKRALNANTIGDLANSKGLTDARSGSGDDDSLEHLNTGLVSFNDLDINLEIVTGSEFRDVIAERTLIDHVEGLHC